MAVTCELASDVEGAIRSLEQCREDYPDADLQRQGTGAGPWKRLLSGKGMTFGEMLRELDFSRPPKLVVSREFQKWVGEQPRFKRLVEQFDPDRAARITEVRDRAVHLLGPVTRAEAELACTDCLEFLTLILSEP